MCFFALAALPLAAGLGTAAAGGTAVASLTAASLGATLAGAGMSAASAMQSGAFQQKEANYQAQVAANQATVQQEEARNSLIAGNTQAETAGQQSAAQVGAARVGFAASGVDPNSGTPVNVISDVGRAGALNQLTIRNNAARQAAGYTIGADSDLAQSTLDTAQGAFANQAGTMQGFGSILSGVSTLGGMYNQAKIAGTLPQWMAP